MNTFHASLQIQYLMLLCCGLNQCVEKIQSVRVRFNEQSKIFCTELFVFALINDHPTLLYIINIIPKSNNFIFQLCPSLNLWRHALHLKETSSYSLCLQNRTSSQGLMGLELTAKISLYSDPSLKTLICLVVFNRMQSASETINCSH